MSALEFFPCRFNGPAGRESAARCPAPRPIITISLSNRHPSFIIVIYWPYPTVISAPFYRHYRVGGNPETGHVTGGRGSNGAGGTGGTGMRSALRLLAGLKPGPQVLPHLTGLNGPGFTHVPVPLPFKNEWDLEQWKLIGNRTSRTWTRC